MAERTSYHLPGLAHSVPIPNATRVGNLLMSSAISGRDPATGETPQDFGQQVRNVFATAGRILELAGGSFADVVKMEFTVKDRAMRSVLDPVWVEVFPDENSRPARHVASADLPGAGGIQLQMTAFID